jgi:hypothetical protein
MRASTRNAVTQNYEYHANLHEHYKDKHEENQKALRNQQKEARREVREARKGDKEAVKEEVAEDVAEVERVLTEEERLRDMHGEIAAQLKEVLGEPVAPAIEIARENPPVVRRVRPRVRPVSRQLH